MCKCHSGGWPWQGAGVLSAFSGCEIKAALGISSARRLESQTGLGWPCDCGFVKPLCFLRDSGVDHP